MSAYKRPRTAFEHSLVAGGFTTKTADNHNDQCGEETKGEKALATRFRPGDDRREKDSRREKRSDHPKKPQLEMPCTREVVGEQTSEVISKKSTCLRMVVCCNTTEQGLHKEQCGDDEEVPGGRALCRRQRYFGRSAKSQPPRLFDVPTQER